MQMKQRQPESPAIRPPSEWRSVLVRLTRGCKWNRCRFCGIYPHMGVKEFSIRPLAEIKDDIDMLRELRPRAETAFFGDADPLQIGIDNFTEAAHYLRHRIPVKRLTCYARASTLRRFTEEDMKRLKTAGLDRVHIGLESGDDEVLRFHRKGQSAKMVREACAGLHKAGIEISFYVLLGLGGFDNWRRHVTRTAELVNAINPHFVRLRRLWLFGDEVNGCPLRQKIGDGSFVPQTPEGTVLELKLFVELLDGVSSFVTCDHANNYVRVAGRMMEDRPEMLAGIDDFLARPTGERQAHYRAVGSQI